MGSEDTKGLSGLQLDDLSPRLRAITTNFFARSDAARCGGTSRCLDNEILGLALDALFFGLSLLKH
jgi:hypothetical protein